VVASAAPRTAEPLRAVILVKSVIVARNQPPVIVKTGAEPRGLFKPSSAVSYFQRVRSHGPQRIFRDLESVAGDLLGDSNRGEFRAQCQKWNKTKFMWAVRGHGTG
jgi:hypothetical protein